jgi:hypothetical protein
MLTYRSSIIIGPGIGAGTDVNVGVAIDIFNAYTFTITTSIIDSNRPTTGGITMIGYHQSTNIVNYNIPSATYSKSLAYGGSGGTSFDDINSLPSPLDIVSSSMAD